jgi:hypothetical protein
MCVDGGRMSEQNTDLKSPVGIYILGVLFMLAPVGNILFSFAGSGAENWYHPSVFVGLLSTIPWVDWIWLLGIFIAGVSLLLRHKMAWMVAVVVLLWVLAMNTYRAFTLDENMVSAEFVRMQILISILVTFSVLIISFYARYPYLDRRQQWLFPTPQRFNVATAVHVHFEGGNEQGMTDSLSSGGARVIFANPVEALKSATAVELRFPEMNDLRIPTDVIEYSGQTLRVKFKNLGWSQRSRFETWLRSRRS